MAYWSSLPEILSLGGFVAGLALATAVVVWTAAVLAAGAWFEHRAAAFALFLANAIVGSVVGFATGLSRVAVVGEVIPAVLVFFGGFSAYLFGIDAKKGMLAALCLITFCIAFFLQVTESANLRAVAEAETRLRDVCLAQFTAPSWNAGDYDAKNRILDCVTILRVERSKLTATGNVPPLQITPR
jgi:hypothetical protein